MNQTTILRALMALTVLACIGLAANPAFAEHQQHQSQQTMHVSSDVPSAAAMTADLLLVRPLALVSTVAGVGVFIVSLPFTLLGDNVGVAAHKLVVEPAAYTFNRPLGDFN